MKTFWQQVWEKIRAMGAWTAAHLLAPGVAVLVVVGAILLVALGAKDLQVGGLLARLLGKKDPESKAIDIANSIDPDRVGPGGKLITPGTPDSKGDTQAVVVPIQEPGLFTNPDTVRFTPPGKTDPIEIQLPDGVKANDVEKVVVLTPGNFVVTVKDTSGVPAETVDSLLRKYGSGA